jgi:hypothetical protein
MNNPERIQGRLVRPDDLEAIRILLAQHPDWNRKRLSLELCRNWNWTDESGRLKDIACRSLLRKLEARAWISLPPPRHDGHNSRRAKTFQPLLHDASPLACALAELSPIRLLVAARGPARDLWLTLIKLYHYLGLTTRVGKNIAYLALDCRDRPVGCFLFGAAAWKIESRDRFIGWDQKQRESRLHLVVNNMRFLIPPWVRVPHLASHLLSSALRRLPGDWVKKYHHPVVLAETFVEKQRFQGTCYRAANWLYLGDTTGRSRNHRSRQLAVPVKAVYVRPLRSDFRRFLLKED